MAAEKSVQLTVKVDPRIVERADALVDHVAKDTGIAATRADVLRIAIVRGLQAIERDKSRAG